MPTDAPPLTDGEPLRSSDAILWNIERDPVLRSTIVVVAVLDGTPDPARLRARLGALTTAFPRFRQRVASGARGRLRWVDAGPVELDHHVRHVRLPAPGTLRQVLDLGGAIAGTALDAARPLWELTVVEGLQTETTTGVEATAVILKMHHAVTDGVGGISLLSLIADDTPEGDTEPLARPARPPRDSALVSATHVVTDALAHPDKLAASLPGTMRSVMKILAPATSALSPLLTERGLDRHFEVVEVSLAELTAAGHSVGGTLNDAFLAATVGGLRHYHERHGVRVEELRVTMPISTRRESDDTEGNRFTPARFTVPVGIADAAERMRALGAIAHAWQHEPAVRITDVLAGTLSLLPPAVTTSLFGSMLKGVDFVATNVPGRRERAWLAGVEVVRLYGFAPPSGSAVSVALVSHGSTCYVGLTIDTRAVSDAAVLGDSVRRGFEEVVAIARRDRSAAEVPSESAETSGPRHAPARLTSRLSALDASFLDLESPTTPMHIGALVRFEGGSLLDDAGELQLDEVRAAIAMRLDRCPRMRQRVVSVPWRLGQPVWENDTRFDIAHHVRTVRLDPPGSQVALLELCCRLQMETLPRDRPLWEMVFVTGIDDGSVSVVYKVHHAVVDGVSAAVTFDLLFGEGLADVPPPAPKHRRGASALVAGALTDGAVTIAQTGAALLRAVQHPERAAAFASGLTRLATNHLVGPPTSLRGPVRGERMLVPVRLSLDAVKAEGRSHDATVNDILLARVTTGLRALLLSRGEHPDHALNALVPISRRRSEQRGAAGNQVTAMIVRLPVDEPDPAGRLAAIRSQTRELKQSPEGPAFATLLGWADAWPPALVALTSKLVHHQPFVNIVVTNVPGPTATLTFLGAAITDLVPVVPLARNLGIGVAIVSYRGELIIGLHADAATCPDVDVMAAAMQG